ATGAAINRLADAGILTQRNVGRQRYRIFEAPTVIELFTSLERSLASPTGDTQDVYVAESDEQLAHDSRVNFHGVLPSEGDRYLQIGGAPVISLQSPSPAHFRRADNLS
ncbi:MAG: hypothetical protein ACC682_16990, partial [Gemmatimonadota bacterium]